jgi:hypothetical protein
MVLVYQALVACTLYNAMAYEAEDDDLDVEIYEELITYSKIFEEHAWKVGTENEFKKT